MFRIAALLTNCAKVIKARYASLPSVTGGRWLWGVTLAESQWLCLHCTHSHWLRWENWLVLLLYAWWLSPGDHRKRSKQRNRSWENILVAQRFLSPSICKSWVEGTLDVCHCVCVSLFVCHCVCVSLYICHTVFVCAWARVCDSDFVGLPIGSHHMSTYWDQRWGSLYSMATYVVIPLQHVHEDLLGLKFRISPDAFFQVNSPAAEVLYSRVGQLCDSTQTTPPVLYGRSFSDTII